MSRDKAIMRVCYLSNIAMVFVCAVVSAWRHDMEMTVVLSLILFATEVGDK